MTDLFNLTNSFNLTDTFITPCEQMTIDFCQEYHSVLTSPLYFAVGVIIIRMLIFTFAKNANKKLLDIVDFVVDVAVIVLITISLAWSHQ